MKLDEMLATFPVYENRNMKILYVVNTNITQPILIQLLRHGLDPHSFASGINFILQHIAKEGLPSDWQNVCDVMMEGEGGEGISEAEVDGIVRAAEEFFSGGREEVDLDGAGF